MNSIILRILNFPITKIILGIIICLSVLIGVQDFISKPVFYSLIDSEPLADTIINYTSVIVLLLTYKSLFRIYERRDITELSKRYLLKELLLGSLFGFLILSVVIGILYTLGYYKIVSFSGYSYMLAPFSFLVIATLMEEILFRGISYRILENWIGTYISLFIISVVFEVPHWFNGNVTILSIILGLFFGFANGIMYTYTKRIWLPFAFHLGWNFAQPFYGSNLSGIDVTGTMFQARFDGPELLKGSVYGIEDSLLAIILMVIVCFVFLYFSIKNEKIIPFKKTNYTPYHKLPLNK